MKTYNEILKSALDMVDDSIDKREGSLIYTALAPICAMLTQAYIALEGFYELGFIESACDKYLDMVAGQFGIFRAGGNACIKSAKATGDISGMLGKRFIKDDIVFECTGALLHDNIELTAETKGVLPNYITGEPTSMEFIDGLETMTIIKNLTLGCNKESDDEFRIRALEFIKTPAFGGNISDYKTKVLSISGVNNTEIFTANILGGGNVGIVIGGSYGMPLSEEVIKYVLETFQNNGEGLAPIGHNVMVKTTELKDVEIDIKITTSGEVPEEFIIAKVYDKVSDMIKKIPFNSKSLSISRIIGATLSVDGTVDTLQVLINKLDSNLITSKTFENFQVLNITNINIEVV